jgi:1-deoxy-D-xylulose-5-phosphate synthase
MERLLDKINSPSDLRGLSIAELPILAAEMRELITDTVSKNGGHLASSLGSVELAIALHYVFDTPTDIILWDVGHQAYGHKIITGRRGLFPTLRRLGGLSGFPNKDENPDSDIFTTGHSSTSISSAIGLVTARDLENRHNKIVAVVGDAALAGGMSFEALNHAGHANKDLIIILNDNELSISQSVGALSKYLNRIIAAPAYNRIRKDVEKVVKRIPRFGFRAYRAARKLEEGLKNLLIPGMLFEEMGFRYFGPIDGHNITQLITTLRNLKDLEEPVLIHVVTKKGKGYKYAEENPASFHGTGPFDISTGDKAAASTGVTFTEAFGEAMMTFAAADPKVVGITAAMVDGTGLNSFAKAFPARFFDVGIAEEHAVTFAAGLARAGFKPVVAVYSTFMQRGYDQMVHDVCLQNLPVVFCLDRAGLVGEDGPTHHGAFDLAYLRHIPNLKVLAPATPAELKPMLEFALGSDRPVAIRYPKGSAEFAGHSPTPIESGKSEVLRDGQDLTIISIGSMAGTALKASDLLLKKHIKAAVINARFAKPIDKALLSEISRKTHKIVTLEDGVLDGGFGSAVLESLEELKLSGLKVKRFGLPDRFIEHGKKEELFAKYSLTPEAICDVIVNEVLR